MITQTFGYNRRWTLDLYFLLFEFHIHTRYCIKENSSPRCSGMTSNSGGCDIIRQVNWIWLSLRHAYWTDVYIGGGGGGGQGGGHVLKQMWFTCTWWHLNGKRRLSLLCKKYTQNPKFSELILSDSKLDNWGNFIPWLW